MIVADVKTVRELDRLTLRAGVPGLTLMERAGDGVVETALRILQGKEKGRVLVVCGKGSNGGDGLDAARKLAGAGTEVAGLLLFSEKEFRGDALACLQKAGAASVHLIDGRTAARWPDFTGFDLVIDAIFGTGFSGSLRGIVKSCARAINASGVKVLSVDAPSGVD
ncbi:MAG: NAD(P)H-hydrate epimerase, partial [Syntrophaceae bacterium]